MLQVRLRPQDRIRVEERARKENKTVSAYVREWVLA